MINTCNMGLFISLSITLIIRDFLEMVSVFVISKVVFITSLLTIINN